jgi:hypothetical protein
MTCFDKKAVNLVCSPNGNVTVDINGRGEWRSLNRLTGGSNGISGGAGMATNQFSDGFAANLVRGRGNEVTLSFAYD